MGDIIEFDPEPDSPDLDLAQMCTELITEIAEQQLTVLASMIIYVGSDGHVYFRLAEGTPEDAGVAMCNTVTTVLGLQLSGDFE